VRAKDHGVRGFEQRAVPNTQTSPMNAAPASPPSHCDDGRSRMPAMITGAQAEPTHSSSLSVPSGSARGAVGSASTIPYTVPRAIGYKGTAKCHERRHDTYSKQRNHEGE